MLMCSGWLISRVTLLLIVRLWWRRLVLCRLFARILVFFWRRRVGCRVGLTLGCCCFWFWRRIVTR